MTKFISIICILLLLSSANCINQRIQELWRSFPNARVTITNEGLTLRINVSSDVTCRLIIRNQDFDSVSRLVASRVSPNTLFNSLQHFSRCQRISTGSYVSNVHLRNYLRGN